jgi:hypothetical protein
LGVSLLPTILNPCSLARCICSLGSPGLGRVVYRYVCAATAAASGVFGIILLCSSTDRKDELRFLERFCLSECLRFSTLDQCLLCLPQLLRPSFSVFHFFLSLVVLIAFAGHNDTLRVHFYLRLLVWLCHVQRLL